jgi:hypothetical protein
MTKKPRKPPASKGRKKLAAPRTIPRRQPARQSSVPNLEIEPSGSSADVDWIVLRYVLRSSSARTLHAYASVRRIEMDPATGLLKLSLDDNHINGSSILDAHMQEPPFIAVGDDDTILELRVPFRLSKLSKGKRDEAPEVQIDELGGFQSIDLRIAYSDTPFYDKPGDETTGAQLRAWAKDIAELTHTAEQIGWPVKPAARY